MKLRIADGLSLPIDAVTEKFGWLGRTGSGKTYGAMKLAELMLDAGAQIGAIDPIGVWRSLRVPATKDGISYEVVVFGGLYGDLPLEPTEAAGHLVADLVCDRGLSFVLDVSQFIPSEQQRFVRAFADRFFHRKKAAPSAVHLFMEECQEFIPENPSGEEAKTLGVMQRLWKLGRNFGIGGSLISQRPQEIAKKALNMSGTLFVFQMTGPQERKAVRAWVADHGVATDIESVLQKLDIGEPHVESPMFLEVSKTVRILPRVTADVSSTPKVGASTAARRPLTPIDVEKLKTSMAATIEKAKAEDPRELRKQIAELKKQLSIPNRQSPTPKVEAKTVEKFVLKDGQLARAEKLLASIETLMGRVDTTELNYLTNRKLAYDKVSSDLTSVANEIAGATRQTHTPATMTQRVDRQVPVSPQARRVAPAPATSRPARLVSAPSAEGLTEPGQRILNALAWWQAAGVTQPMRHQVAFVAGYSVNGHFNNTLGNLRTSALVDYPAGGAVSLTDAGARQAVHPGVAPTREDLISRVTNVLRSEPQRRLFTAVVDADAPLTREDLAARVGYTVNGHFNNTLGSLRSLGVIEYPAGGYVGLSRLFEAVA